MAVDSTICQKLLLFIVLLHGVIITMIAVVVLCKCNRVFLKEPQLILKDRCKVDLTSEHDEAEEDVADRFGLNEHLVYFFRCEINLFGVGVNHNSHTANYDEYYGSQIVLGNEFFIQNLY